MNNDEINKLATQFIELWQENFTKLMTDDSIAEKMQQVFNDMQGYYDQSSTAADNASSSLGNDGLHRLNLYGRIDELEARIAKLEADKR